MSARDHWEDIYRTKAPDQVSWYQPVPERSLSLVTTFAPDRSSHIVDIGGGTSSLVDALLGHGYSNVTVCDIAEAALDAVRARLGAAADAVSLRRLDVLNDDLPEDAFDLWHDRAVFHFLTQPVDRQRYVRQLSRALRSGGHLVIAGFAPDGPERCSGLDVMRHSAQSIAEELGDAFRLLQSAREEHRTPAGAVQKFEYCVFGYRPRSVAGD